MADEQFADRPGSAGAEGPPQAHRGHLLQRLAWLPIPLLIAALAVLWAADLRGSYELPSLGMALNFIFSTLASLFIVYLVSRSFLTRGTPGLLMLGCGVLTWGAAGIVANALNKGDANVDVTIHNIGVWLSALFHLASALLLLRPRRAMHTREVWLGAAYGGVLGVLALVALAALHGYTPTFFVQGTGGTPIRQFVLGSAIVMFLSTAGLLKATNRRPVFPFASWYALGLASIAVGLLGILLQSTTGGLLPWVGRSAMYLSGVYMFVAAIAAVRESGAWQISLEAALRESEERFRQADEQRRLALESANLGTWSLDVSSGRVYWDERCRSIFGITAGTTEAYRATLEVIHPADRDRVDQVVQQAIVPGSSGAYEVDFRVLWPDASVHWITSRARTWFEGDGPQRRAVRLTGTLMDITERKRAEEALRESERLQGLLARLGEVAAHYTESSELIGAIGECVAGHLGVSRCGFSRVDVEAEQITVLSDYHSHLPSLAGTYPMQGYADYKDDGLAGRTVLSEDVAADPRTTAVYESAFAPIQVRAHLTVPLIRDGQWVANFWVSHHEPRRWTAADAHLMRVVADRVWTVIERQRAAEALRESEEHFRALATASSDVVYRMSPDWSEMRQLRGRDFIADTEVASRDWLAKYIHPDDQARVKAVISEAIRTKSIFELEHRVLRLDGTLGWTFSRAIPLLDDNGEIVEWFGAASDVTARKRAEKERDRVFEYSLDMLCVAGFDGYFKRVSPSFEMILGWSEAELLSRPLFDFIHPDDREGSLQAAKAHERGKEAIRFENRYRCKDGSYKWISWNSHPVVEEQLIVGVARDITERKRAEARLTADLAALTRMHAFSGRLLDAGGLHPLLQETMDAAVAIVGAERGTLQLLEGDSLRIVAHHGHEQPFLEFFAAAENRASVCGEATKRGERVVVPDIEKSALFAETPSLAVLRQAGVRAVQSTPMVTRKGTLLGILTTQWGVPHSPDEHDLWRIDLLVRQAADLIEYAKAEESLAADLAATTRLQQIGARFVKAGQLADVLGEIVDAAIAITHADMGNIQLLDARSGCLRIAASRGFEQPFLDFWNAVAEGQGACGTAMRNAQRVIVEDVAHSPIFVGTPALEVQINAGVRAIQSTPLFGHSGDLIGMLSTHWQVPHRPGRRELHLLDLLAQQAVDIVERARAEEAVRQSEERYRELVENANSIVMKMDREGNISFFNDYAQKFFGYSLEEVLGQNVKILVPPVESSSGRSLPAMADSILRNPDGFSENVNENVRKNGQRVWISWRNKAIRDASGDIVGNLTIGQDITDRKRAEEALRQAYGRLQTFFDHRIGGIGIVIANAQGGILQANDYYLEILGCTRNELQAGQVRWTELTPPEWRAADEKALAQLAERGVCDTHEKEYVRRDGSRVPVLITDAMMPGEGGDILAFVLDITERKQAELQLKELNETLEKRVAERTAVAEMRAEQLRMLAQELTQAEQRERQRIAHVLHEHFQQLLVGAKFSLSMVRVQDAASRESLQRTDQVLSEAVEASRSLAVELSPPILRYGGLAPALGWLGQWMHEKNGLKVEIVAEPHVPMPAEDVQVLLFQAVRELLLNVVKHAKVDQAKVELKQEADRLLRLSVSDKGAGFHADGLLTKACVPGGFGLFSIRERLSFLEGRVEIQSAPGAGTCISLLLPLPPATQASAPARAAAEGPTLPSIERGGSAAGSHKDSETRIRVLIADDHAIVRDGMSRLLQTQPGMEIVGQAKNGREAVELALQVRPDVVIMDVSMPEMNGIEATRCILADLPGTRIIGLSMHTDQDVADQMRRAGAVAYLAKSGPTDELVAAIRKCAAWSAAAD